MKLDTKAIRVRADAATATMNGGDRPSMRLADRVRSIRYAFGPGDNRYESVRALANLADLVELSSRDVPALCDRVEALEVALKLARQALWSTYKIGNLEIARNGFEDADAVLEGEGA